MKHLLKLLIAVVFFGALGLTGLGLVQEDYQPTLETGRRFLDVALAAAFVLGPGVAFIGGSLGRAEMERDLAQARSLGETWGIHALIAEWMSRSPVGYYLVLSLVCVGAFGGGAWGALTYLERNNNPRAQAVGSVQCTVLSTKAVGSKTSPMADAQLQCPVLEPKKQGTTVLVKLRVKHPPVKWPATMALPVYRGPLGTVFLDGSRL